MSLLGNIIWIIFGGLLEACIWFFLGVIFSITIIGLPIGYQCFKYAGLSLAPFGKEIYYGGSNLSFIANVIWIIVGGIPLAIGNLMAGCILCATIIGIPFGLQYFKLAKLSLMPFGARIV